MLVANKPAVEFFEVTKTFANVPAVDALSLRVEQGQLYVLLGKNGAGKTTSLRMLAGLESPDQGKILVHGRDIANESQFARAHIAFLPDDPLLYDLLKPLEYLEFVAGLWDVDRKFAAEEADFLLLQLDLWEHRGKLIKNFSRGMKQKLALAGGLIHKPSIIILDEPLTGLDALAAKKVKDVLRKKASEGVAIILTTHILEVAEKLADKVAIIDGGRIVADGPIEYLLQKTNSNTLEDLFLKMVEY
ncbi:ABC transporter ATP-binding protein [Massilia putida]|uniref:ABC transporter ATP-binding protein n=1 Tax=Massilia putida TaxID=1141883 RepID=UPI001E4F8A9D|nr:ABC transporter ATP-binding protein [Massilia putida]